MLRPHHDRHLARRREPLRQRGGDFHAGRKPHGGAPVGRAPDLGWQEIALADEVGDEALGRTVVDVARRADLQDPAGRHHRDAVRHGQRLLLVVGDEDEGDAGLVLQALQLDLHFLAQLVVERRQRFVEQKHLGLRRQRAGQRDALLLAAGNLAGAAVGELFHAHKPEHLGHARLGLVLRTPEHLEAEADVLGHRHVREQRVGLEDGVDRPPVGRQACDLLAVQQDLTAGRVVEAGDQPKQRGLAAARRPQQREELVLADRHRHAVERGEGVLADPENLAHATNVDGAPIRLIRHTLPHCLRPALCGRSCSLLDCHHSPTGLATARLNADSKIASA